MRSLRSEQRRGLRFPTAAECRPRTRRRATDRPASSRFPSRSTWSQRLAICARGGDPEAGLDHAPEHHAEPERARRVGHSHGLPDPARFRELEVDPVRPLGAGRDVGEREAVLVHVDRNGRAALQLGAGGVAGGKRLLAVLDRHLRAAARAPRRASSTRSRRPGAAASVAPLTAWTRSRSSPSRAAELQLEPAEAPLLRRLRPPRHVVGIAEPDRPRRRRPFAPQAEQLVDRNAGELPLQIVQRRIERSPRRGFARRQPRRRSRRAPTDRRRARPSRARRAPKPPSGRIARSAPPHRTRSPRHAEPRPRRPRRRPATRARS